MGGCWREARHLLPLCEGCDVPALLEIPDVRQRSDYGCGDAAVDAALGALGLARKRGTRLSAPEQGMPPDVLAAVLRASGCEVLAGPILTGVDGLKHFAAAGCPAVCPVADHGGHWVVVRGVRRGRVHFHCPLSGPASKSVADWVAQWADVHGESGHRFERWAVVCSAARTA